MKVRSDYCAVEGLAWSSQRHLRSALGTYLLVHHCSGALTGRESLEARGLTKGTVPTGQTWRGAALRGALGACSPQTQAYRLPVEWIPPANFHSLQPRLMLASRTACHRQLTETRRDDTTLLGRIALVTV